MDHTPTSPYLQVPADALHIVRKDINMERPGDMREAVRILKEWVKQQSIFLEKDITANFLEMTIVSSKGSLEKAKRVIMNMFTARTLKPEEFQPRDLREYHAIFKDHCSVIATPRLTSEYYRIVIVKVTGKLYNDIMDAIYKFSFSSLDYLKAHDYHTGCVLIIDMSECDLPHFVSQVNLLDLKNCIQILLDAYGMRLKRTHLITSSKTIQVLTTLLGPFLGKKIMGRMVVNGSVQDISQYYCRDALPREYGGCDKTIEELQEELLEAVATEEHVRYMKLMSRCKLDKYVSPANLLNVEDGVYGTFRSINVD